MLHSRTAALLAALLASTSPALAQDRVVTFNSNASDPAPKAMFETLVADFEAENPDIDVQINTFDHEGFKTSIRNFMTADPPDVITWFAGNRMKPFVDAGQLMDISDVWAAEGVGTNLASAERSVTFDDKQWGMPYSYYQWGIYYNRDAYDAAGIAEPATDWEGFLANCETFKQAGIDCLTTGSKALWPLAGLFDLISLRVNGYDWHMQLTNGEIPWTDDSVRAVFTEMGRIAPYITADHAAIDWQDAVAIMVQGKAAHYVMGNFSVAAFKDGGMTEDNLGFMSFPTINPDIPRAEEAPTETLHIPAGAANPEDAKLFLTYLARADVQTKINGMLGQLPVNAESSVGDDPYLKAGFEMLSTAEGGIAQFFDRDAPAEMAKVGMEGFQEFLVRPDRLDQILERLERQRERIYAQQ